MLFQLLYLWKDNGSFTYFFPLISYRNDIYVTLILKCVMLQNYIVLFFSDIIVFQLYWLIHNVAFL